MHLLQPVGFFEVNPALDVPPSTQAVNKSTRADVGAHVNGSSEKNEVNVRLTNGLNGMHVNGDKGPACCSSAIA
jgi:hypothetical protein